MKNLLSAFTVERLTALIEDEDARVTEREQELLAEIALAALTTKPVAYTDAEELETLVKGTFADMFTPCEAYKSDHEWIPLFTMPPAADADPIYQLADDGKWYDVEKRIYEENVQAGYQGRIVYAGPAPAQNDYFGSLVAKARASAEKAMMKFPQPNYVLLKVAEEAGEVVQAGVHYAEGRMTWQDLEGETVQLLAMLIRLVTEGDHVNGIIPPKLINEGAK